MVAIVSGNSLGLSLSSLSTLGGRGVLGSAQQGRGGDGAYVNVANGNLVLQGQDDVLVGRGLGVGVVRTYNSRGLLGDDNGDNWHVGAYGQRVVLNGVVGAVGSTLVRNDRDGASATYTWDAGRNRYVSSAGAGAFDTIAHDAANARYVWTDGASGLVERYDSAGGRLVSVADPSGNTIGYAYNANGTLQSMVNANGETTYFDYIGVNLTQIRTVGADASVLTRVRYAYDTANRLSTVTVDLSPQDNSVADGKTYVTTYTYDGASKRVASATQSDGTSLNFTYVQVAPDDWRVATLKDGLGQTTSYSYDLGARTTAVTDPLGLATVYSYDAAGQLTQIKAAAVGGVSQITVFGYDANGNVIRVTDAQGFAVDMAYDANGNQVLQRDAAGNTVTRTFDARNQLITEAMYLTPDADGAGAGLSSLPQTTRYVYDAGGKGLLRFVLSAEGRVVEHRYDSYGQRVASLEYGGGKYNVGALGVTVVPTEAEVSTWVGTQDRTQASRSDTEYDARGQVKKVTVYARVDASGVGVADGSQAVTQYVYDRAGLLLSTVSAAAGSTVYTYDGKGRQLSAQDALNQVTLTSYDDANNKTVVTLASGLITTSAYDRNGRLVSLTQGSAQSANLGVTMYAYDKLNRLVSQTDATGARVARLYDEAGRLVGEVNGAGRLTEYVYDKNNQVTQKIVYATAVNATALAAYFSDPNAAPVNRLATLRPAGAALDQKSWRIYDGAGRLVRTVDALGAVVDLRYDGASRLVGTTRYNRVLVVSVLAGLGAAPTLVATAPAAEVASDRAERRFYDADGLLVGVLDAEGYLTESRYDAQRRLTTQIAYANPTPAVQHAAGTLAQLIPALDATKDQTSRWLYDAQDRVVGQIDAEGYLTERVYDVSGNVLREIRYDTQLSTSVLGQITGATQVESIRPGVVASDRTVVSVYDKLNRVTQRTNHEGTLTQYVYDKVGNVVSTTSAVGTTDARVLGARYDVLGRLVGELTGVGSALLVAGLTQAQIDAIWSQYGLTHAFDAAGRRISTTDGNGNKTLYYYDLNGQLTHSINALGEVQERQYDTLGQLSATIQYGTRLASLAGLTGGLANGAAGTALSTAINGIKNATLDTKTSFTYTLRGELASAKDVLGNVGATSYNAFGDVTGRTQDLGGGAQRVQTLTVDRRGLVTGTVSDASGVNAITSAVYDAFGRLTRSVDANGNVQQQGYDRLGRVVSSIDGLNAARSSSYDAFARVKTLTDALGRVTSYMYDDALRTVTVKTPENVSVKTSFTRQGQRLSVVDGNGNTTSFAYDKNGNLLSTTTALTTTTSTYDRTNRLIQTKDANGTLVELAYDAANRLLTRMVDKTGLNLVTTYGYDAKGQQVSVTDPNGTVTKLVYDLKGQLVRKEVDPTGLKLVTQYSYDGVGNTLTVIDPNGVTTQYVYDKLGRRVRDRVDPAGLNLTREYTYDKNGNVIARKEPGGEVTRYVYDAEDRLVYTLDAAAGLQRLHYDAQGRVTQSIRYAKAIDLSGLPAAPAALTVAQLNAKVVVDAVRDAVEHRVLDKDGRLVATVNGLGEVVTYGYDANGNVVERKAFANRIALGSWVVGTVPAPTADAARDQRLGSAYDALNRVVYTIDGVGALKRNVYDANGNVVERIAYAAVVPVATAATAAALSAAIAPLANASRDVREVLVYDRAHRLSASTDGVGTVTLRTYDKNGRVTSLSTARSGPNLFTQSEFANGLSDLQARGGLVTATTMAGYAGALQVTASTTTTTTAYKTVTTTAGATYTLSVIVQMDDGQPPSFGNATFKDATNSFVLVMNSGARNPQQYVVQDLGGGRYRVSMTAVSTGTWTGFGIVKYMENDARGFKITGYQLEQSAVVGAYASTGVTTQEKTNLLTQSEFGNGLADAPIRAGDVTTATMKGMTGALRLGPSAPYSVAYKTFTPAAGETYALSVIVEMEDGQPPSFGNATIKNAANTFALVMFGGARSPLSYAVQDLGGGRYRVVATGVAPTAQLTNFGIVKYAENDTRAFRVSGYQLEKASASAGYAATTTAPVGTQVSTTRYAYDAAGRLVYTVGPLGELEKNTYDAAGRVTQVTRYASAINTVGLPIAPTVAQIYARTNANLLTQSEFANGLADMSTRAGDVTVAAMTGMAGALRIGPATPYSVVYKSFGTIPGQTYTFSMIVEMEDGQPPSFGSAITNNAANSFALRLFGTSPSPTTYVVQDLGSGRYRVSVTGVAPAVPGPFFGFLKYAENDTRAFRVSGFQLEQASAASAYVPTTAAAPDQQQHNVYDKAGRLVATLNALGETVRYTLDANGRVLERRAYVSPVNMATWIPGSVPAPTADDARDQKSRSFYDAAGRELLSVDALGHVQQSQYDALGRLTRLTRYPKPVPAATANTYQALMDAAAAQAAAAGLSAQVTVIDYDAAGRKTSQTEAWGRPEAATTAYVYSGLGLLTQTVEARGVALSQSDSTWALVQRQQLGYVNAAGGGLLQASLTQAQRDALAKLYTTSYVYDAAGRRTSVTDPLGGVTQSAYDANGNVIKITDPRNNAAYYYFDATGRVVLSVDPEGYATVTAYNMLGKTLSVKRHFTRITTSYSTTQAPVLPTSANDALTQFEYDAAGRLVRTIDAENRDERYTYDALGQRKTLDNKLRGVTTYEYDRAGRVLSETLPITSKNAGGTAVAVVNRYTYDAFGNKLTSTEAAGLPEQRVTTYGYDGLNRQLTVRQSTVSVYTQAGGWTTATPTRTHTYDAVGNLIVVVDPNGGRTRSWFDANNRKIAEVSATGTLSRWEYDVAGNVLSLSVYGDALTLPVGDALPVPVSATNLRQTTYKVDANNRVVSSTIAGVSFGWHNPTTGQYEYGTGNVVQESLYDANGNVVRQKNAKGVPVYTWYDKLGQKVLEVDGDGYAARWERDANGSVLSETRFAKAIPAADLALLSESNLMSAVLAKVPEQTSLANRITSYTYDRNARVLSESRLNVANGSVNAGNGALTEGTATATKRYAYDAMGNQIGIIDALNQRTDLAYDLMGRLRMEQKPAAANEAGVQVRQTKEYEYDGLNNVRREIRRGLDGATEADDQIIRYGYDATGVRTSMVTAKGESFTYGRDANGNTTAQLIDRKDADLLTVIKEIISIAYDAGNREISRFVGERNAGNAPVYDVSKSVSMTYNAYGQLSGKKTGSGNAAGAVQEYYDYDNAGRLWRTNSQGGVSKAWVYDLAGNAALQMESQTRDLRAFATVADLVNEALGTSATQILTTITAYNKRNQAISVTQPKIDATRPNLVMVATQLSVDSGQFGGLNITVGSSQQGQGGSSILGPIYGNAVAQGGQMQPGVMVAGGRSRATEIGTEFVPVFDFTTIGFGTTEMEATYRALYGHIPAWKIVVRGPNGAAPVERAVEGGGAWPKWLFDFGTYKDADLNTTTIELYAVTASGRQVMAGQTLARALLTWGGIAQVPSGTFLRLSEGEIPAGASVQLYHRPQGSSGPYEQSLPIFRAGEGGSSLNNVAVDGWYMTRLDGWGPTELLWVVTRSDGAVLRRDAINWSPPNGVSSWVAAPKPVFRTDGWTHFTGLRTSGGGEPTYIRVQQRAQGSTGAYSVTDYGQVSRGRFEAWFDAGDRDVMIELLDGNGQVIERQRGLVNRGNSTYNMQRISELPSTIKFQGIPLNATSLTVNYTPTGTGKPAGSFTVTRDVGATEWLWDTQAAGLVLDNRYTYNYNISFVARDSDGFKLTEATGNVTVGAIAGTTSAQLTGSSKPQVLQFDPGIAAGQTLKIRYREKGAAAQPVPVYGPPVITGYNADGTAIFGKGYSAPIVGRDALGKPIYGAATATTYTVELERKQVKGTWSEVWGAARPPFTLIGEMSQVILGQRQAQFETYTDNDGPFYSEFRLREDIEAMLRQRPGLALIPVSAGSPGLYRMAFPGAPIDGTDLLCQEVSSGPLLNIYEYNAAGAPLYSATVARREQVTPEDPSKFITGQRTLDFLEVTATRTPSGVFKWDATNAGLKQDKEYEYLYDVYNAQGTIVGTGEGYFRPDNAIGNDIANRNIRWIIPGVGSSDPSEINSHWQVKRGQDYDAFGQVISETDGRGNVTTLNYNTLGQLVDKIGPATRITLANGQEQTIAPTEHYSYNLNGQLVGKRDANGNQSTLVLDALGQALAEWHPSTTAGAAMAINKAYDIFGNLRKVTDEIGRVTDNAYDKNNRLTRVDRPANSDGSRAFDVYEYDALGQRIAHQNALGFRERTYYDSMGRVVRYISAEGREVKYAFTYDNTIASAGGVNTGGWIYTTTSAISATELRVQTLKNDVFGRLMWKQDLGGHEFTYSYNWSGLIATQIGTSGQNITYSYYGNGYLRKVIDAGVATESYFEYDNNGNRTFEGYKSTVGTAAMVFQQSTATYDAFNRIKTIQDGRYTIEYEYDANGNRRRVHSVYNDGINGTRAEQDYWYLYDGMNRFTLTMGQRVGDQIVRGSSGDGVSIEYDNAGQRKAAIYARDGHREDYAYDGAGALTTTHINGVLRARRTNDLGGRVTLYEEFNESGVWTLNQRRSWDRDNMIVREDDNLKVGAYTVYSRLKDGTLSGTDSQSWDIVKGTFSLQQSRYSYEWWDTAKQKEISILAGDSGLPAGSLWAPGFARFVYDVNGHIKEANDPQGNRTFKYWADAEGRVLQRDEFLGGNFLPVGLSGGGKNRAHHYFYFDGRRVGNVGNDGTEREDYAQQLAREPESGMGPDSKYKKFTPINSADFDENFQPINASYPATAPSSYTVRTGDTLESIARSVWGDATLWYLLAEANGLAGQPGVPLVANTVLTIPNRVTNVHNTSDTFRPYDPGKAMGDTSPTLPHPMVPPSKDKERCGGFGEIIVIVVSVVAAVLTTGASLSYFNPGTATVGGVAVTGGTSAWTLGSGLLTIGGMSPLAIAGAGAIGGAVGSAAGQLTGMALGIQDRFSWKGVLQGALSGGVSAGVGNWLNVGGGLGGVLAGTEPLAVAGRMALGNIVGQGLGMAVGLQRRFDWKGVAASAASGYVSAWVGQGPSTTGAFSQGLAARFAGSMVSAAVRGGSLSNALPGIMADALGSTIGNVLGDSLAAANDQRSSVRPFGETDTEPFGHIPPGSGYNFQGSDGGITNWQNNMRANAPGPVVSDGRTADSLDIARGREDGSIVSDAVGGYGDLNDGSINMAAAGGPSQGASSRTRASAAELRNQARELSSRANQLSDASDYQQAANKAYYDGQSALVQATEVNSQNADASKVSSTDSQGQLPANWNMRDASAAVNSASSMQPPETELEYRIRLARGPQLTALPSGDPYERARANLGIALAGTTVAAAIAIPTTAASLSAAGAVYSTVGPLGTAGIGAVTSGGMDVAMQYYSTGKIRPTQAAFAATIGAVSGPVGATSGPLTNFVLGTAGATLNTGFQNVYYGENKSFVVPALVGGSFGILGYYSGARVATGLSLWRPENYYANLNRGVPALFQPRSINIIPATAGATVGGIASGFSPKGEDAVNYFLTPSSKR